MMIKAKNAKREPAVEKMAIRMTEWVGTPTSIIVHSIFFVIIFGLYYFGIGLDSILLILTTIVSLEAIYLALFIQMTVNRQSQSLEEVEEDLGEIAEDVEGLEGGFGEIVEDVEGLEGNIKKMRRNVEELEADVEDISEDIDRFYLEEDKETSEEKVSHVESSKSLQNIEKEIIGLSRGIIALRDDLEALKKNLP